MYLSPPDVHCLGPIKMELSAPQANLQAALQVLELHHSKLDTTKVQNRLQSRILEMASSCPIDCINSAPGVS